MTLTIETIGRGVVPNDGTGDTAYIAAGKINSNFSAVKTEVDQNFLDSKAYADNLVIGLWDDRGNFDASVNTFPTTNGSGTAGAILKGDIWTISSPATSGVLLDYPVRTTVRALINSPGQTPSNWAMQTQPSAGWYPTGDTLTYVSSDIPAYFAKISGANVTAKYSKNQRIKFLQTLTAPLTSLWNFNASTVEDSVGTNHGTATAITYTSSSFGLAATFNGTTSKIDLPNAANLKPTADFTLGIKLKTDSSAVQGLFQVYSNNGVQASSGYLVWLNSGNVVVSLANNTVVGANDGNGATFLTGNRNIADNLSHEIVVTVRDEMLQIYIDGELDAYKPCKMPVYSGTLYPAVGAIFNTSTPSNLFSGTIDEIYMINGYALEGTTIKSLYSSNTAMTNSDIVIEKFGILNTDPYFDGTDTQLQLYLGTDYFLADTSISGVAVSNDTYPVGFPSFENKWTIHKLFTKNLFQSPSVANTVYNLGGYAMTVPEGEWELSLRGLAGFNLNGNIGLYIFAGLSTKTSAFSNSLWKTGFYSSATSDYNNIELINCRHSSKEKTTIYALISSSVAVTNLWWLSGNVYTYMTAKHTSL